ncbi:hypothetical protein SFC08_01695 [Lysinibacillus halotolerans]
MESKFVENVKLIYGFILLTGIIFCSIVLFIGVQDMGETFWGDVGYWFGFMAIGLFIFGMISTFLVSFGGPIGLILTYLIALFFVWGLPLMTIFS